MGSKGGRGVTMRRRKAFKRAAILAYWAPWLVVTNRADSVMDVFDCGGWCFACGMRYPRLQHAHIKALCEGGADDPSNIHVLCRACHSASEHRSGDAYFDWIATWTLVDSLKLRAILDGYTGAMP